MLNICYNYKSYKEDIYLHLLSNVQTCKPIAAAHNHTWNFLEFLKPFFPSGNIEKIKRILPDFYFENLVYNKLNYLNNYFKEQCEALTINTLNTFEFIPHSFTYNDYVYSLYNMINHTGFTHGASLFIIVTLISKASYINLSFFNFCNSIVSYGLFINTHKSILNKTYWVYTYIYNLGVLKLWLSILSKVYNNIKYFIIKFKLNYNLHLSKSIIITRIKYVISIPYKIMLGSGHLNEMYASFTVLYILQGWLMDYLSYIWIFCNNNMKFKFIFSLVFWMKRSSYALLYMTWIYLGVFSTNGIYFSIVRNISNMYTFNLFMLVLGSTFSCVFSNLWFFYGLAVKQKPLNLLGFFNDIIPRLLIGNFYTNFPLVLWEIYYRFINITFSPMWFNTLSSFRRSFLEWLSFFSIVVSTYGSWNLYILHIFPHLTVLQNFGIWLVPSFLSGYGLIYIEVFRPRFSNIYYGIFYLTFWTAVCFSSNSILVGFFDVNNSLNALYYLMPSNFVFAFIYNLPFYRLGNNLSILESLVHLFQYVALIFVTLLCAGLLWNIIGSM